MSRPPLPINTHGSISHRPLPWGAWKASCNYRDSDGVTRRVAANGETTDDATARLMEALAVRARPEGSTMWATDTLATAVQAHLLEAAPRLAPSSLANYERVARLYVIPGPGRLRLHEVTPSRVVAALRAISERSGPATSGQAAVLIRAALDVAVRRGAIDANPARSSARGYLPVARGHRHAPAEPPIIDPELIQEVRAALRSDPRSVRIADAFDLIAATGLQVNELLGLQYADRTRQRLVVQRSVVDPGALLVQAITPRPVHLPQFAVQVLRHRERAYDGPYVFGDGRPVFPHNFSGQWREAMDRTGVERARTVSRRVLRSLAGNHPAATLGLV